LQSLIDSRGQQLDTFIGRKDFVTGERITYVDFSLFEVLDLMNFMSNGRLFEKHSNLAKYWERIERLPKFCDYWADDEKCIKVPFNNKHAKINNL